MEPHKSSFELSRTEVLQLRMSLFIHIRVQSLFYRSTETRIGVRDSTVVNIGDHDHEGEAAAETWDVENAKGSDSGLQPTSFLVCT